MPHLSAGLLAGSHCALARHVGEVLFKEAWPLAHLSELGCEDSRPRPCPLRTDGGRARERRRGDGDRAPSVL